MGTLVFDLRYALRGVARSPVFTLVTVGTLALGIGANSAIFSLVNAALLRPLGYADAERLMVLYESFPERNIVRWGFSPPDFEDLLRHQRLFSEVGAYRLRPFELSGGDAPEQVVAAQVTSAVFSLLGVPPTRGRILGPDDVSDQRVVVLSHGLWQRRFGASDMLGKRVVLSRQPHTVVGVMPATFEFPKRGTLWNGEPADLWMPLVFNAGERQARGNYYNHSVIARLRDGVTPTRAMAEMPALARAIREQYPAPLQRNFASSLAIDLVPYVDDVSGQVRWPLLVLLAAVGLVLVVACANIANLMLSRAVAREREIGVRTALGAARGRLLQMLLTENLFLALLAGGIGLFVGNGLVRALPAMIRTSLPGVSNVSLDFRVVGFALALALVTAVIFSIVPLVVGGRRNLNDVLREGGTSAGSRRRHRLQAGLVVVSVSLAFVLLVGAGLLTRSMLRLLKVDSGVNTEGVVSMRVTLPFASYNNAATTRSFYWTLRERLAGIPGVRAGSISTDLPLDGDGERRVFTADSMDATDVSPTVAVTWVHGDYFVAFGIPIVRGRTFTEEELLQNRLTAVVSRGLAERYWPGEEAVGKRIRWGLAEVAPENPIWMTVVGISGDVVDGPPGSEPVMHIYVPFSEVVDPLFAGPIVSGFYRALTIAVRTDGDEALVLGPVRNAIAAVDPALAVTGIETLEQVAANAMAPRRFSAVVLASFAGGALLLAAIGLYGVLVLAVAQRTREIGIRLALGANAETLVRMVLRHGMVLTGVGLIAGGATSLASARLTRSLLYDTSIYDPWTFLAVLVLLPSVALVASYIPARRAARVDPLIALRVE
jgi:putative ABC transport system permease protein